MMRQTGLGVVRGSVVCFTVLLVAGCARPPAVSEEPTVTTVESAAGAAAGEVGDAAGPALTIREIKLIEDNGQQGLFVKLSAAPLGVTNYVLEQPNRVVLEITGAHGGETSAEKYAVDNPVISEVRTAQHEGRIRLTMVVKSDSLPAVAVNDLNDTVVAFLGEPTGSVQPVREQIVFTRRALQVASSQARPASRSANPVDAPAVAGDDDQARQAPPARTAATVRLSNKDLGNAATPGGRVYTGQRLSLDFKDADVHNVLRLIAEVSKLNVVATDDVKGKVTLRLFDVPWDQALEIVLQVLNLESERQGNVVRISTVKRLREDREELQRAQEAARKVEPLRVEYIRVNYAKAKNLGEIISGAAAQAMQGGRSGGRAQRDEGVLTNRGSVLVDEFSNTLVVRDIQRGIDNARELVRNLDVQTPQVLIESSIVEAGTDFARELGVQWGYRGIHSPETGNPTGVNFPGRVGVGGSGLGVGSGGVPFIADFPAAGVAPGAGSALDLALGSLDGSKSLDLRLTALEDEGKARIISRPRVVTLNNVAATIKSLTIIRVKLPSTGTVINTGAGGAAGAQSTATERIETGIILTVTPQMSSDGFVLLDMFVKSSQADFTRTVDQIPTEISREANSHILVKDGQTVVLGGIYRDNFADQETGIPFLKDLPGVGWMFKSMVRNNRREDLIVFLTPRVLTEGNPALPSASDLWMSRDMPVGGYEG
jgi:type IV pilus secretin PilQ/predicted competence protein